MHRAKSVPVEWNGIGGNDMSATLEWLDESEGGGDHNSKVGPPSLYIDDRTVLEEVRDVTALRRGDHCVVGLNVLRKVHWSLDWMTFRLARWGVLRLYHHFVMMDDVAAVVEVTADSPDNDHNTGRKSSVSPDEFFAYSKVPAAVDAGGVGDMASSSSSSSSSRSERVRRRNRRMGGLCGTVPLSPHGTPALICEYGQTVAGAWAVLRRHGWRTEGLWRLLAPYQKLPLADYVATAGLTGIFRVKEHKPLSEGERCWIILEAERNAGGEYEPYDLFRNNCESAAFGLSPRRTRRVTPEVPMMFWMMFRWALVLVGVACLFQPSGGSVSSTSLPPSTFLASQTFSGNAATHVTTISKTTATTPTCSFSPSATSHCCERSNYRHVGGALRVSLFHLFVTVPLGLQLCIQLVRSTVHLTSRRSHLGERGFHHLLSKEVGRSVFVGSLSLGTLVHLPEISASSTLRSAVCASAAAATSATATAVAAAAAAAGNCHGRGIGTDDISDCTAKGIGGGCDGGGGGGGSERWPWHWVAFTAFFALPIANALFGVLCWVVIEVFKWCWGGVPVLTFVDSTPSLETATTTSTGKQPPAHPLKKVLKETTVAPPLKQLKKSKKSKKKMEKAAVIAAALAATATTAPIGNSELLVGTQRHREGQHRRHLASPVADPGVEKRKGGK